MIPIQGGYSVKASGEKESLKLNTLVVTARTIENQVTTLAKMQADTLPKDVSRYSDEDIPHIRTMMTDLQSVAPDYIPGEPVIHIAESLGNFQYQLAYCG
jgi:hypothetical protein